MKTQAINILILDKDTPRAKNLMKAFKSYGKGYYFDFSKLEPRVASRSFFDEEKGPAKVDQFDLLLVHGGDAQFLDYVSSKTRIWFGGYGEQDGRISSSELIIVQPILEGNELSSRDIEEIIALTQNPNQLHPTCLHAKSKERIQEKGIEFLMDLQVPEKVAWDEIHLPTEFLSVQSDWIEFKNQVSSLITQKHKEGEQLTPFDPTFIQLFNHFQNRML